MPDAEPIRQNFVNVTNSMTMVAEGRRVEIVQLLAGDRE